MSQVHLGGAARRPNGPGMTLGTRTIAPPDTVPAGANSERDGIRIGDGRVKVDAYIDFLCPFCRMFEESSGEALDALVGDGAITLVYHPLGFLDRLSTTAYSSRAAAASGCASDTGAFREYARALFAEPATGGRSRPEPGRADRARRGGRHPRPGVLRVRPR